MLSSITCELSQDTLCNGNTETLANRINQTFQEVSDMTPLCPIQSAPITVPNAFIISREADQRKLAMIKVHKAELHFQQLNCGVLHS